jgi:glucose/arabinose dehydrogenase
MRKAVRVALVVAPLTVALGVGLYAWFVGWPTPAWPGIHLGSIRLPAGFRITVWSEDVPGARSMTSSPRTLFVGTRPEGRVYALRDEDGDGRAERRWVVAEGLDTPNGVAWKDGALYVAELSRVIRFDGIDERLDRPPEPVVVHDGLPEEKHHGWKFVRFGPDGRLYVPVGAPGNAVLRTDDARFAAILRETEDRRGLEVFASGVRNTVGFDWHPETKELWFTDNGRDWMGEDRPPDELDRAPRAGLHFGYPFVHGRDEKDPELWEKRTREDFVPPEIELGPHVAALGMRFYTGTAFPERYRNQVFVAEHGSWNRTSPLGYRVSLVRLEGGKAVSYETFAEGWLTGPVAWGRPVDVEVAADGALLVSDDRAGAIYRIAYAAPEPSGEPGR